MAKRILDLCGGAVGLLVTAPVLAVAALAIKLGSRGPVLHTSVRVGQGGRLFRLYKLRSMVVGSEAGPAITGKGDTRITRVGAVLRALRIDEIPQLVNVLKGDMSLVGPRPEAPSVVERYTAEQREILSHRPGLTGPTQLAWLDEASHFPAGVDHEQYYVTHVLPQKLQSDLRYVRTRSLRRDLRYLVQTPLEIAYIVLNKSELTRPLKALRMLADCGAVAAATYFAFIARFDGVLPPVQRSVLLWGLPLVLATFAFAFAAMATCRSLWW